MATPTTDEPTDEGEGDRCCNCGAGPDVPGGLTLTPDLDRWICRRDLECIRRAGPPPDALDSSSAARRRAAIDADYARRGR